MSSNGNGALQKSRASTSTSGYSVRKTEEAMDFLQKENFTLKLKIFLDKCKQGEPVVKPEMDELCDREFVDIVMENQMMRIEYNENQNLLKDALKAIENLEAENSKSKLKIASLVAEQKIPKARGIKQVREFDGAWEFLF